MGYASYIVESYFLDEKNRENKWKAKTALWKQGGKNSLDPESTRMVGRHAGQIINQASRETGRDLSPAEKTYIIKNTQLGVGGKALYDRDATGKKTEAPVLRSEIVRTAADSGDRDVDSVRKAIRANLKVGKPPNYMKSAVSQSTYDKRAVPDSELDRPEIKPWDYMSWGKRQSLAAKKAALIPKGEDSLGARIRDHKAAKAAELLKVLQSPDPIPLKTRIKLRKASEEYIDEASRLSRMAGTDKEGAALGKALAIERKKLAGKGVRFRPFNHGEDDYDDRKEYTKRSKHLAVKYFGASADPSRDHNDNVVEPDAKKYKHSSQNLTTVKRDGEDSHTYIPRVPGTKMVPLTTAGKEGGDKAAAAAINKGIIDKWAADSAERGGRKVSKRTLNKLYGQISGENPPEELKLSNPDYNKKERKVALLNSQDQMVRNARAGHIAHEDPYPETQDARGVLTGLNRFNVYKDDGEDGGEGGDKVKLIKSSGEKRVAKDKSDFKHYLERVKYGGKVTPQRKSTFGDGQHLIPVKPSDRQTPFVQMQNHAKNAGKVQQKNNRRAEMDKLLASVRKHGAYPGSQNVEYMKAITGQDDYTKDLAS